MKTEDAIADGVVGHGKPLELALSFEPGFHNVSLHVSSRVEWISKQRPSDRAITTTVLGHARPIWPFVPQISLYSMAMITGSRTNKSLKLQISDRQPLHNKLSADILLNKNNYQVNS